MVRKKGSAKTGSRRKAQGSLTSEKQVEEVEKWMVKGSEAKDPKEALKYYKKAVEIDPTDKCIWQTLAETYYTIFRDVHPDEKAFEEILKEILNCRQKVVEIAPNDVDSWIDLGYQYLEYTEEPQEAINCFKKAIELSPNNAFAWYWLSETYSRIGENMQNALEAAMKLIKIDPTCSDAWLLLGTIKHTMGDPQKALECLENAFQNADWLEIEYTLAGCWEWLGQGFEDLGSYQRAIQCLEKALEVVEPERRSLVFTAFAGLYKKVGDCYYQKMFTAYESLFELVPQDEAGFLELKKEFEAFKTLIDRLSGKFTVLKM